MHQSVARFLQCVSEAFALRSPIYEFTYVPGSDELLQPTPPGHLLYPTNQDGDPWPPTEIERLEDLVRLPIPDAAAGTVIATGALEHVFEPYLAAEELIRILAPGGMLVVCSQSPCPPARNAERYWHPTPRAVQRLLSGLEATLIGWQGSDHAPHTLFGIGCRATVPAEFAAGAGRFLNHFQKRLDAAAAESRWWSRLKRWLTVRGKNGVDWASPSPSFYKAQFVLHLPVRGHLNHRLLAQGLPEEDPGTRLDMGG